MRAARWIGVVVLSGFAALIHAADRYVAQNGQTPDAGYTAWATAASNIQDAVNVAEPGATVWVGPGRYTLPPNATNYAGADNVVYVDRLLTLCAVSGAVHTAIDGEGVNRGIAVSYGTASSIPWVLDGFTVTNGLANYKGGGLYLAPNAWTARVENCVISDNTALSDMGVNLPEGGGLYASVATRFGLLVSNCVFRNNRTLNTETAGVGRAGALLVNSTGRKLIADCLIEGNSTAVAAGGVLSQGASYLEVERSILRGNRAEYYLNAASGGGALYVIDQALLSVRNCLIHDNWVAVNSRGGGINCQTRNKNGILYVDNTTIVSNRATFGGGIYTRSISVELGGTPTLYMVNSIVQSNTAEACRLETLPESTNVILYSSYFPTNETRNLIAEANLTNSPAFADFAGHDFRLGRASPCINTGTNQEWMIGALDLDGNRRVDAGTSQVDMGCYEFVFPGGTFIVLR